jgi:hypothetical protein
VTYERFVVLMPSAFGPLSAYLKSLYGKCSGISFLDSTALAVCDNHRIHTHKVFEGVAERGKGSMGWFYGLKLHLVVNDRGEILACQVTPGNTDDRKPVTALCKGLFGKLVADRGYISQALFEQLFETFDMQLITRIKRNMKNRLMLLVDKILLRKRAIIESVFDQLKNVSQIEHTPPQPDQLLHQYSSWFGRLLSSTKEAFFELCLLTTAFVSSLTIIHVGLKKKAPVKWPGLLVQLMNFLSFKEHISLTKRYMCKPTQRCWPIHKLGFDIFGLALLRTSDLLYQFVKQMTHKQNYFLIDHHTKNHLHHIL